MAQIGTSYRILYTAKNRVTGLSGIIARFVKPDNSIIGDLPLVEFANILFKGMYYTDLLTSSSDPVGCWIGVIYSPNEGNYRTDLSINFEPAVSASIVNQVVNQVPQAVWSLPATDAPPAQGTYGDFLLNQVTTNLKSLANQ